VRLSNLASCQPRSKPHTGTPTDCGKSDCGLILAVANADGSGVRELTPGLPALDRLRLGHVVDFILVHWQNQWRFPAFNIADSAITVGAVMLALDMFRSKTGETVND